MSRLVVDASVAIKWFVDELDTALANAVYLNNDLIAPELLAAECANILWKKSRRGDLAPHAFAEALLELEMAAIELCSMGELIGLAGAMARRFDHPAYDCFYLALAAERAAPFVTADLSLVRKLRAAGFDEAEVLTLAEAAALAG